MAFLQRKYLWLTVGIASYGLSFFINHYYKQFIFLGGLGVIGYFVYDALEFIHELNARHLNDMRANLEIIMADRKIDKDELVHRKINRQ